MVAIDVVFFWFRYIFQFRNKMNACRIGGSLGKLSRLSLCEKGDLIILKSIAAKTDATKGIESTVS